MSSREPEGGDEPRGRVSPAVSGEAERARSREDAAAKAKMLRITGTYSYIGIEFGVAIALGWFAGGWLDERFGWSPWGRYALMGLGLLAAFRDLFRLVRRTNLDKMDDPG
jgi:F0F1-type ATP synthase assembly protein I